MKNILILSLAILLAPALHGQNIRIVLGPDEVALNQYFTITLEVQNERLQGYDNFPEISGFEKRGTSSSSSMNWVNGQVSSTQSIVQNYLPQSEGTYRLPPFTMTINGQKVSSPGKTIRVVAARQQRQQRYDPFAFDPFEEFFGQREETEFIEIKDDAFFALTTDKDEVYVGEGFTMSLAFYVSETEQAPLQFYETGQQLGEILKTLRPANCWEENLNIENINKETVTIGNKRYGQYKIYQATYFPLNKQPIHFESVPLKMIKYKVAKNPGFFGRNRVEDFKTYNTKAKTIRVKELPPHPLRDQVSVGRYRLDESITDRNLQTGQSFNYQFAINGEGNISAIDKPILHNETDFDFYPPNIQQRVNRAGNRVRGSKVFNYHVIPGEPGEFDFSDMISWIYFNIDTKKYDTLRSDIRVRVEGESKKNQYISSNDLGSFYDMIELESNTLRSLTRENRLKLFTNILLALMMVLTAVFIFKK
ncbi:MAG: BatD family protein [Cyclobacteriaceae bacterium]